MITNTHLKNKHNMTINDYKNKWDNAIFLTKGHIKLLNTGKSKLNVFGENNLVSLCKSCHSKIHGNILKCLK